MMNPEFKNVDEWLKVNKDSFHPPVCNKLMHNSQLKVFYVGGPNTRQDFHLEEGEELFYMHKGNICLRVLTNGKFQDIKIREGEVFLLPAKIPHSPQRRIDTKGLVIERERSLKELDCVRYYVEDASEVLFERWFHCVDLGSQLGPLIAEFFASDQHRTGKPLPGTITDNPPYHPDATRKLELPINLWDWVKSNTAEIQETGWRRLYGTHYETDVIVYGKGQHCGGSDSAETFIWQLEGSTTYNTNNFKRTLQNFNDTLLIPKGSRYIAVGEDDSLFMAITMDPKNKERASLS